MHRREYRPFDEKVLKEKVKHALEYVNCELRTVGCDALDYGTASDLLNQLPKRACMVLEANAPDTLRGKYFSQLASWLREKASMYKASTEGSFYNNIGDALDSIRQRLVKKSTRKSR